MEDINFSRVNDLRGITLPCLSLQDGLKIVFAGSISIIVKCIGTSPVVRLLVGKPVSAHCDAAQAGRVHLIRQEAKRRNQDDD